MKKFVFIQVSRNRERQEVYMEWRFISYADADAYTNMAVDEAIMAAYCRGNRNPTLRLYGWNPPAVSIGYFQCAEKAVNIKACKESEIDVVRRLTGGRAVLHEHEITYSIIIGEDYPGMPQSVVESYKFLCEGLLEGLNSAGVKVSMESGKKKTGKKKTGGELTQACFDSPSTYEIVHDGKKLVGSAQLRRNGVILQHGSILVDVDIAKHSFVMAANSKDEEALARILEKKTAALKQIFGDKVQKNHISDMIFKGYCKSLGITGEFRGLCQQEESIVNKLVEKYSSQAWTFLK